MKIDHIYLDMDGVLVDWIGGLCDLLGLNRENVINEWPPGVDTETALNLNVDHMWNLVNRHGFDWWANLNPLETNGHLFALLTETTASISILTSPDNSIYASSGKILWINNNLSQFENRIDLSSNKERLSKPGTLLIDDKDCNCERFREEGGHAVLFPQPWNKKHDFSGRPLASVKHQLTEIISQEITG